MRFLNAGSDERSIRICIFQAVFLAAVAGTAVAATDSVFYVKGRYLYDYCGEKVVLRGVNDMVTWTSRDGRTMPHIAKTGANCLRIVALLSDKPSDLDSWITICRDNKMIPMPELHNATGDWSMLGRLFDYWIRPDVLAVLKKHEKYLLINIGNEVGDGSVTAGQWVNDYGAGIRRMRAAGINACLVVDATSCGQKIEVIISSGHDLLAQDPHKNILFSAHAYWPYAWGWSDQKVKDKLQAASDQNLAYIIGEFGNKWDQTSNGAIPYKLILEECQRLEVGWLAWSWGPGNNPQKWLDMTSNGTFGGLSDWGLEVATTLPTSIKNTSIRPASIALGECDTSGIEPPAIDKIPFPQADANPIVSSAGDFLMLTVPASRLLAIDIFDIRGRYVRRVYHGTLEKGQHLFQIDSRTLTKGIYAVRCSTPGGWVRLLNVALFR